MQTLLQDAVRRAERDCPARMRGWYGLIRSDATEWLDAQPAPVADVIYLDPMFGGGDRRALPKHSMQILTAVVGGDADANALFAAARPKAGRRLVVKRHGRAPPLAPPDAQVAARGARFDIYTAITRRG